MNKNTTDFSWINTPSSKYLAMVKAALANHLRSMEEVKSIPDKDRNFENTVHAMGHSVNRLYSVWGQIDFLMNVKPNERDREAAKIATDYMLQQFIELEYDEEMFKAYAALEKKKPKLSGADKKLFADSMKAYRRMGFGMPKAKRDQIKKKTQALSKLASDFRKNINDHKDAILVTRAELQGLPEGYINGLNRVGGKYQISLAYPDYLPFMENSPLESKRKILSDKYLQKGGQKNMVVLSKMIKLRQEIAKLLGYKNHADYVLEVKMAKDSKTVLNFLEGLVKPLRKKVKAEISHLEDLKKSLYKNDRAKIEHHDLLYLMNQDKKQRYAVDDELVREYFPLDVVTKGMFTIYEKLLGVKFKPASKIPTWHPDVQAFSVNEAKTGEAIAYFFLDLYPRKGKYSHAAVFPIIPGAQLPDGAYQKPVVGMVCNFPKPTKQQPSLLNHHEVSTYFHEFGHIVHGVLTKAKHALQSGTSVERDFVEAPSQMLENWVWDEKMLQILSGHYRNPKKKLPKELLKNMLKAKLHMVSYITMRQLSLGTLDMRLHTDSKVTDAAKVYADVVKDFIGITMPKKQIFPAGFGHLDGYDAGYYGYMWSLVYAADMFTRFTKSGLLSEKVGRDYRKKILEPGASKDAIELIKDFLGRKPNTKAFLKQIGL